MDELLDKSVVIDAHGTYVYLGVLERIGHDFLVLRDADAHDLRDSPTMTREQYVLARCEHGLVVNRARIWINRNEVVAVSRMADIIPE